MPDAPRALAARHWMLILAVPAAVHAVVLVASQHGLPTPTEEIGRGVVGERDDNYVALAAAAAGERLRRADVLILGSSSTREALWEDEQLGAACRASGRSRCDFLQLVSSAQSAVESLFLLYDAPLRPGQTVLVFTTPILFAYEPGETLWRMRAGLFLKDPTPFAYRYQIELPELAALTRWPERALVPFRVVQLAAYRRVFLGIRNAMMASVYGQEPAAAERYWYLRDEPGDLRRIRRYVGRIRRRMRHHFVAERGFHGRALAALILHLKLCGARVVLMETPTADFNPLYERWWPAYQELIRGLCDAQGIEYVDLNESIEFEPMDFVDSRHTSAAGREKWSQALLAWWRADAL
jgi:hypothetical protein